MKNADTAMYHAKEKGRNNFQFFSPAMTDAATERLELERDLRSALANSEFELHYQPQVCATKNLVRGVEALIRWRHPERGLIPPLKFIPIAEETGVIEAIGTWVLNEACRQMALWREAGFDLKHVAVNVSAHQLRSPDLVSQVQAAITRFGLSLANWSLKSPNRWPWKIRNAPSANCAPCATAASNWPSTISAPVIPRWRT